MATGCTCGRRRGWVVKSRLLQVILLVLLVGLFCCWLNIVLDQNKGEEVVKYFPHRHFKQKDVKQILIWTPFLSPTIVEGERDCMKSCDVKCVVTGDKSDVANSDAVDFHLSDLWPKRWSIGTKETIKFPQYRHPDQVWILSNMEPPPHLWGDIKVFNGVFNWTRWYRSDATLPWKYGTPYRLTSEERIKAAAAIEGKNFHSAKTKGTMLRISNCFDPGRRYRLIKELSKYLDIDKYGLCYDKPCGDPNNVRDKSCDILLNQYRFYLALENDNCKDYVTEKYWLSLHRNQIPLVNWRSVNESMVIPNSYINIYDFENLQAFAEYVKTVNENEALYNSYFEWRKVYADRSDCNACIICRALHDPTRPAQTIQRLDKWVNDDICPKTEVWNNIMKNVDGWIFKIFGL